jgi:hypothetical protein
MIDAAIAVGSRVWLLVSYISCVGVVGDTSFVESGKTELTECCQGVVDVPSLQPCGRLDGLACCGGCRELLIAVVMINVVLVKVLLSWGSPVIPAGVP